MRRMYVCLMPGGLCSSLFTELLFKIEVVDKVDHPYTEAVELVAFNGLAQV